MTHTKDIKEYVKSNLGKFNVIDFQNEIEQAVRSLSDYPSANLNQIIFFCKVLDYLKQKPSVTPEK